MIVKGFVLDDERLKQGKHFGKDYFDDLLERIREIRASERRYYQKSRMFMPNVVLIMTPNLKRPNCFQDGTEYDALGCYPSNGC